MTGPDLTEIAGRVLDRVAVLGADIEADVVVTDTSLGLTRFANSFIHQHVGERTTRVDLRLSDGGRVATGSVQGRVDNDTVADLARRTHRTAGLLPVDPHWAGLAPPEPLVASRVGAAAPAEPDPAARAAEVAAFVAAGDGATNAAGFADTEWSDVAFANSAGQSLRAATSRASLDGIHRIGGAAGYGHATAASVEGLDGAAVGATAAGIARQAQQPRPLDPGTYEVVLSPECVAELVSYLAFAGFNAKSHLEGQSFARIGDAQFDAAFSLRDDATDPRALGLPFDIEGTPKRPLDLVRDGVVLAVAHDRRTAARAGAASTGHAIPGGTSWGAFPSNLFLAPGTTPFDDLVSGVSRGLLVTTFNYVRILDPKTQVVTGLTRNGTFLIEDGKIAGPVRDLRFTQSVVSAFGPGNILAVGDDARMAASEFGQGIIHTPSFRLREFRFTGGEAG